MQRFPECPPGERSRVPESFRGGCSFGAADPKAGDLSRSSAHGIAPAEDADALRDSRLAVNGPQGVERRGCGDNRGLTASPWIAEAATMGKIESGLEFEFPAHH